MTSGTLNIPKKINVGFQKRNDTYTGKLAYIIYFDAKGKLRKEGSWNGWRDGDIPNEEFDNVPTEGFVLNKKAGDYSSRWGGRSAYCRVYDPRGFEFEIDIDNLIYILEECSSIKGKGLQGEFVYAWDGKNLALLPAHSIEYKESQEYTDLQVKKIRKKDMTEGCIYIDKNRTKLMYLGRHEFYEPDSQYRSDYYEWCLKSNKMHIFKDLDAEEDAYYDGYVTLKGFTTLAIKTDDEPSPDFAKAYMEYKESKWATTFSKTVFEERKVEAPEPTKNHHARQTHTYIEWEGAYYPIAIIKIDDFSKYDYRTHETTIIQKNEDKYMVEVKTRPIGVTEFGARIPYRFERARQPDSGSCVKYRSFRAPGSTGILSKKEVESIKAYECFLKAENGSLRKIS